MTSCDIHPEAIVFIKEKLGIDAIKSNNDPELFRTPIKYDVVFALSFFSHMPDKTWGRWLAALGSKCVPGGYLIFTTHGLESRRYFGNPELDSRGYWFTASSEQADLSVEDYGQTIVTRQYVSDRIEMCGGLDIVHYEEAGWWGHQDVYVLRRRGV